MRTLTYGGFEQCVFTYYTGPYKKPRSQFTVMLLRACLGVDGSEMPDGIDNLFNDDKSICSRLRNNKDSLSPKIIELYNMEGIQERVTAYFMTFFISEVVFKDELFKNIKELVHDDEQYQKRNSKPYMELLETLDYMEKRGKLDDEDLAEALSDIFIYCVRQENKIEKQTIPDGVEVIDSSINVSVRKVGERDWKNSVDVNINDTIECQIHFKNQSKHAVQAAIRTSLPNNMMYVVESTQLYNSRFPLGASTDSDILSLKGVRIGGYAVNGDGYVRFKAKVIDYTLVEGLNKLIIWGKVSAQYSGEEKSIEIPTGVGLASANVYVRKKQK